MIKQSKYHKWTSLNGHVYPSDRAQLSITDMGLWYDFGVFESLKVIHGVVFHPELHIARLKQSAKLVGFKIGASNKQIAAWIDSIAIKNKLNTAWIKIAVYGNPNTHNDIRLFIFSMDLPTYPDEYYSHGAKVITYEAERFLPQAKSFNMLTNFTALQAAKKSNALESILINHINEATEGTRTNLFVIDHKNRVIMPPHDQVLGGVTKTLLLDIFKHTDLNVIESVISEEQLISSKEVFITSTSMGVMPITTINNVTIGKGKVGPITQKVMVLWAEYQDAYMKKHGE